MSLFTGNVRLLPGLPCAIAGLLAGLLVGLPQSLAEPPHDPEALQKSLESRRSELDKAEQRAKFLQADVDQIAEERQRINARLLETASLIQKSEAELSGIEARLGELDAQEKTLRGSLEQRHDQISKLMSALLRMGRNPPPVIMTHRSDALAMVRSAMLLASTFPELRTQALALAERLNELVRVISSIRAERERLKAETARLSDARARLASFKEAKRTTLLERQAELAKVRADAAEISKNVSDLSELIAQLDKSVTKNTTLKDYEEDAKRLAAADRAQASAPPAGQTAPPKDEPKSKPLVVVLGPQQGAGLGNPGRIKPAVPFQLAKGRLPLPAHGRRVIAFADKTQYGGQSKGIVLETRASAQITSPCDGWIVYAGEFRSYGQLLIINAGGGYHILLAGLSQIDVQPGQFVLAGEPVGTMSGVPAQGDAERNVPVLYVEFRKDGRPIDPDPWWAEGHQKVQG